MDWFGGADEALGFDVLTTGDEEAIAAADFFPNIPLTEEMQQEVVTICQQLKQGLITHASLKKQALRECYAYTRSQFVGNDLLPIPASEGSDRDLQTNRPRVFVPLVRQQLKQIYSYLKLTIFPNDEDYFRVRGRTAQAAMMEDDLTDALKNIFRQAHISEKIGLALYNICWAGNSIAFPTLKHDVEWEWRFDTQARQYVAVQVDLPPMPDVEAWNPVDFYIDPNADDAEKAKWGYFTRKKIQEMLDSPLYFNQDRLFAIADSTTRRNNDVQNNNLSIYNGLSTDFEDNEKSVDYDLFYFPVLNIGDATYRNMLVGVAGEQVLVRFHPNVYPKGLNPAVFFNWTPDVDSLYGTGPIEDIKELQRLINILYNYMVEVLARIGNRFIVTPETDLSNLFGIAGGVGVAQNPHQDVMPLTGNYGEIQELANIIGTIKADAQITSQSQNPFQGASSIDFKKTATEMQILQENSVTVMREIIEHITVMGPQRILERLMLLCADLYTKPVSIRKKDPVSGQLTFKPVDLSVLKSGQFDIELVSINASQSKNAQVNSLMQLLQMVNSPDMLMYSAPVLEKIGQLQGIRDIDELMQQVLERINEVRQKQPGIPTGQAGPPAAHQPAVAGPAAAGLEQQGQPGAPAHQQPG